MAGCQLAEGLGRPVPHQAGGGDDGTAAEDLLTQAGGVRADGVQGARGGILAVPGYGDGDLAGSVGADSVVAAIDFQVKLHGGETITEKDERRLSFVPRMAMRCKPGHSLSIDRVFGAG